MIRLSPDGRRWLVVALFAVAMAWVESACVYYLRVLIDRIDPFQPNPLPIHGLLGQVELVREAATMVMLGTVGWLAGRTVAARIGYAAVAFGVWDICYYVFLRVMGGWPRSLLDWDILFLLPLPWWGPVLAPMLIATLMIVGGTMATRAVFIAPAARSWWLQALGIVLALYVFMADALRALSAGLGVSTILPATFNWLAFWIALALMAVPLAQAAWLLRASSGRPPLLRGRPRAPRCRIDRQAGA